MAKDEEPGTNALLIVQIQGLATQIAENLSKIRPKTIEQEQTVCMAKEELDVYQRLTLVELQKSFE